MKLLILLFLSILLANTAYADDPHSNDVPRFTKVNVSSQAMALAVSEINPTLLSSKWQMGVGFGIHQDETAIAAGLAKRVNKNLLFSSKIAKQSDDIGVSMGLNFKF